MSCIQQNFPSKFEPNDAFYEKLEENTFVAFILKHPVAVVKVVLFSILPASLPLISTRWVQINLYS